MSDELYTPGKIAEKLGVSKKAVNDAIKAIGLKPDQKKGNCLYYSGYCVEAIGKMITDA